MWQYYTSNIIPLLPKFLLQLLLILLIILKAVQNILLDTMLGRLLNLCVVVVKGQLRKPGSMTKYVLNTQDLYNPG